MITLPVPSGPRSSVRTCSRVAGFTLVETVIALVLSSFVIGLVSHAFLVQNRFYATQSERTVVQDNVRAATELLTREIRGAAVGGVVVAGPHTLTVRSPMVVAAVCFRQGSPNGDVLSEGGPDALDTGAIAGVALWNDSTWDYRNVAWGSLAGSDLGAPDNCASNGADTTGVRDDFYRLTDLNTLFASGVREGDVVMLFRETTFSIRPSALDSTTLGLFRADYGASPVEFATGIDSTAVFAYRTSPGTYVDTVSAGDVTSVDAVRLRMDAWMPPVTGGTDPVTFGWTVTVPLMTGG